VKNQKVATRPILVFLVAIATVIPWILIHRHSCFLPPNVYVYGLEYLIPEGDTILPATSVTNYILEQQSMCSGFMAFQKALSQVTGLGILTLFSVIPLRFLFPLLFYLYASEFTTKNRALLVTLLFMLTPLTFVTSSSYLFRGTIAAILLMLSLICLVKLTKGTAHPKWAWLTLALVLLTPLPFIYYTGLIYIVILFACLSFILLVINAISSHKLSAAMTMPIPAYIFIIAFFFLGSITCFHAVINPLFRGQMLSYVSLRLPAEPALSTEPTLLGYIAMEPYYTDMPWIVSLFLLQHFPLALFGLLYIFYLINSLRKGRLGLQLARTIEGRLNSFLLGVLLMAIVIAPILAFKGFAPRWDEIMPWVGDPSGQHCES